MFCEFEHKLGFGTTIFPAWRQNKIEIFSKAFKPLLALVHWIQRYKWSVIYKSTSYSYKEYIELILTSAIWRHLYDVRLTLGALGFLGSLDHSSFPFSVGLFILILTASVACRRAGSCGNFFKTSNFRGGIAPLWLSQTCLYRKDPCRVFSFLLLNTLMCPPNRSPVLLDVSPS